MSSYSLCARPDASHGHPYLVFDCQGELHLPLIVFAKEAQTRLAPSSIKKYLTNILPFLSGSTPIPGNDMLTIVGLTPQKWYAPWCASTW